MRFHCPNCFREEEIIRDRKPRCPVCRVDMLPAASYLELWMSPYAAIVRMWTISDTYGNERGRTERRFQKEREAFAAAVLAVGLTKLKPEEWWVEIDPRENTPDVKLHRIDQSTGRNTIQTLNIEVVDWQENVEEITEVIRKKCTRAYPKHFLLVIFARHIGKTLDADKLIEDMKQVRSPFLEVWVVGVLGYKHFTVFRIVPSGIFVDLDSHELEMASHQTVFLKKGKRGLKPGFHDLGDVFLPIP